MELGITGKLYRAIKNCYDVTENAIRLNGKCGDWFKTNQGVKQGDNMSPNLYSAYVNELLNELECCRTGVTIAGHMVTVLAYADDLVLISATQAGLQRQLDILERWCK